MATIKAVSVFQSIKEAFKPVMNKKNYLETLDSLNKSTFYEKENN